MTPDDTVLVQILAAQDSVWAPLRLPDWGSEHGGQNIYAAQQAFPSQGVPWLSAASREADRRTEYRRLERLAVAEWLDILPSHKKAVSVRLTPRGEWRARSLAGLPSLTEAHLGASVLADIQANYTERVWTNECIVLGGARGDYDAATLGQHPGRRLWVHQSHFFPLLRRGIVIAGSDIQGHVYYLLSLTDEHMDFLAAPPPESPVDLPPADSRSQAEPDVYFATWQARREQLRTRDPDNPRDIGPCPLPCGVGMVIPLDDWDREPKRRRPRTKKTTKAKPKRTPKRKPPQNTTRKQTTPRKRNAT